MSELQAVRAGADALFALYRKLEGRRIDDYRKGHNPLEIEKNKAVDHFILYVALHQLVQGNEKGYEERKALLQRRLAEAAQP